MDFFRLVLLRFRLHSIVYVVLRARGCLRSFFSVIGCPIGFSLFQVDSGVVCGCRLQKSCFVSGLFLLL